MTTSRKSTVFPLWSLILAAFATTPTYSQEAETSERQQPRTRQAPAVSKSVYDKIVAAQALVSEEKYGAGLNILSKLEQSGQLSHYELSQVLQNVGRVHLQLENMPQAIAAFGRVLLIPDLEEQTRKTTLYILAQLHTADGNYDVALNKLHAWFSAEPNPGSNGHVLHAQILYQLERYPAMISAIESAIAIAQERGKPVKESWYVLLSYGYFQEENFAKVRDVHKVLIKEWPSKRYWLSLAGAFAELGEDMKFAAAYDIAHTQGLLAKEPELVTMAQLYLQQDVPYKAARLLEDAIENGSVSATAKSYRLLSQAWSMAQEDEKAVPALQSATKLSDDGALSFRLGNAYLNLGRDAECIEAINSGLEKGGLNNLDHAYISLGMCHFNQREYRSAIRSFRSAAETPASRRTALAWIDVIRLEIARDEEIAKVEAKALEQQRLLIARRAAVRGS